MNRKQLNNIVILVGLLVFIIYYLNEPFDFNILASSVYGRFIIILLIIAASKQNIYLGYLAVVGIIGLLQNLEEENIVTIKKPHYISSVEPYEKEGFQPMDMGLNLFETGSLLNFFPLTNSLMYNDNLDDNTQYSIFISEETIKQLDKEEEKMIGRNAVDKKKMDSKKMREPEYNYTISDILELQQTIRPKDSSTMIGSPLFFDNYSPSESRF